MFFKHIDFCHNDTLAMLLAYGDVLDCITCFINAAMSGLNVYVFFMGDCGTCTDSSALKETDSTLRDSCKLGDNLYDAKDRELVPMEAIVETARSLAISFRFW